MAESAIKSLPLALVQHLFLRPADGIDEALPDAADIRHGAVEIGIVGQADGDVVVVRAGLLRRRAGRQRQVVRQEGLFERGIFAAQPRNPLKPNAAVRWKGTLTVTKRVSPFSLYRTDLASFTMGRYNPKDAEGFINLFALPVTVRPKAKAESGNN